MANGSIGEAVDQVKYMFGSQCYISYVDKIKYLHLVSGELVEQVPLSGVDKYHLRRIDSQTYMLEAYRTWEYSKPKGTVVILVNVPENLVIT